MEHIVRHRPALTLLAIAGGLLALAHLFQALSWAVFSLAHLAAFRNLTHAYDWSSVVGHGVALAALGAALWSLRTAATRPLAETAAVALGGVLVVIGSLVTAATSESGSAGNRVTAVGFGVIALAVLAHGALNVTARRKGGSAAIPEWLVAGTGAALYAIATGLNPSIHSRGEGIAQGVLLTIASTTVAAALLGALTRRRLRASRPFVLVVTGLALEALAGLALTLIAAVEFGDSGTLRGLQIGGGIEAVLGLLSVASLGLAAVFHLVGSTPEVARPAGGWTAPQEPPAGPGWQSPPSAPPAAADPVPTSASPWAAPYATPAPAASQFAPGRAACPNGHPVGPQQRSCGACGAHL